MIYSCPKCGGQNVELLFPVWVDANDMENREKWEPDFEAQPERDGDKGWCRDCEDHILVTETEEETQ
jgi:hypothetical protein